MYDLVIVGGGPAGVAAGIYTGRKKMKTALITDLFGGQSLVSADIQNWIGTKSISGLDLAKQLEAHLRAQEGVEIVEGDTVEALTKTTEGFALRTKAGKEFETKTILLATGSRRKRLGVPGELELEGKGVAYCSICDAPLFRNKAVAVVGGGNAGLEAVVDLLPYASQIHLLEYGDALRGDPVTQEKIKNHPKVAVILNVRTDEIVGTQMVEKLRYVDMRTGAKGTLDIQGVFVEIGIVPNSDLVKPFVKLNERGEIIVDHKTQATSLPGIWAAGDVADVLYKQNNVSVGDAIKAVLNIYDYLNETKRL